MRIIAIKYWYKFLKHCATFGLSYLHMHDMNEDPNEQGEKHVIYDKCLEF